jgi:ferredoxin
MPVNQTDLEEAIAEGVKIRFLAKPTRIRREGDTLKLECLHYRLGAADATGRRSPEPVSGSEFTIEVDNVISATGQRPEIPDSFGLTIGADGTIQVAVSTLSTGREGVFAGGDCVTGSASIIDAIASGRQAAIAIDKYLGGKGLIEEEYPGEEDIESHRLSLPIVNRIKLPTRSVSERIHDFDEVELSLEEQAAVEEAKRCLQCSMPISIDTERCTGCRTCQVRCSAMNLGVFNPFKSCITITRDHAIRTTDIQFSDECRNCGLCVAVCNYGALTRVRA